MGKTNLGELQSGYATNPNSPTCEYCTTALNPYDVTRSPQGTPHLVLIVTDSTCKRHVRHIPALAHAQAQGSFVTIRVHDVKLSALQQLQSTSRC